MNIENFYSDIKSKDCPKLGNGNCATIEQLFNTCIKPNLPKKETVIGWNDLLLKYANDKDAIFFVRKYGSASNKNWNNIRRGFLTKFADGFQYVYVDNFFAHYIYLMALKNFVPSYEEFKSFILSRKVPYGFMQTSEEAPHQAFPKGKVVPLNTNGWKLAHLYSVNEDYNCNYKSEQEKLFPLGDIEEWKVQTGYDYPLKLSNEVLSERQKDMVKAHFLRFVHPINYFLVPKTKLEQDDINNNIGEYEGLIDYVYLWIKKEYADELEGFEKVILAPAKDIKKSDKELGNEVINIRYGSASPAKKAVKDSSESIKSRYMILEVPRLERITPKFVEEFSEFCSKTGSSNKGSSYGKAIQYLAEYLDINLDIMDINDIRRIVTSIVELKTDKKSSLYIDLEKELTSKGRKSYLKNNYISAALPPFLDFCKVKGYLN